MLKIIPTEISDDEKINWVRLARSESVGPATFFRLLEIFGSAKKSIEKMPEFLAFTKKNPSKKTINIASISDVEKEIYDCKKYGAEILAYHDSAYPRLLREIYDPPAIITILGNKSLLNSDSISIIGPRNASFHGCKFARKIAKDLGECKLTITSGLARGIDSAAHEGSIETGTIAVIAGGIDNIYPRENMELYHKISKQGAIVSESRFGAAPKGINFVMRNRIVSGISYGVVVIEAGLQSGSLITARCALEQGREVFAVPGFPDDPRNFGSNRLIKQGAVFTENVNDILTELSGIKNRFSEVGMLREPDAPSFAHTEEKLPQEDDLNKIRNEIAEKVGTIPISIEEIILETQAPTKLVNIALAQLELSDEVSINYGKVCKR
jgi:DNA processing protein